GGESVAADDPVVHPGGLLPRRGRRPAPPDPRVRRAVRRAARRRRDRDRPRLRVLHLVLGRLGGHDHRAGRHADAAAAERRLFAEKRARAAGGGGVARRAVAAEAAGLTAVYAFVAEVLVHRDLDLRRDVPRVMAECGLLVGGVLLILGVALGFTNYLVDARIPERAVDWVTAAIHSRWMFLVALN